MGTILENIEDNEFGYDKRLIVKGAVEIVLDNCSHYFTKDGQKHVLIPEKRKELDKIITSFAENSLRCLCLAYKDLKKDEGGEDHDEMHDDQVNRKIEAEGLTCIAIIGIRDVIRPEVPHAIAVCNKAQVRVRMVTGDNIITAKAIAKDCGILPRDYVPDPRYAEYEVTTGPEFARKVGGI